MEENEKTTKRENGDDKSTAYSGKRKETELIEKGVG